MGFLSKEVASRLAPAPEGAVTLVSPRAVDPHGGQEADSTAVIGMITDELSPDSRRKYMEALADLARFLSVATPAEALTRLALADPIERHRLAYAWCADLHARGLAAATVAVRLAALRAAWDRVLRVGLASGPLKVKGPKPTRLKDARGPDVTVVRAMLDAAASQSGLQGLRDVAILGALATMGLRRAEVAKPLVEHFDRDRSRLMIVGKGNDDTEWVTVPPQVSTAIGEYLNARGATRGEPLFARTDRAAGSKAAVLCGGGIRSIVVRLAARAGVTVRVSPHGFRHTAITMALEGTSGDVRRVAKLSRHAKIDTVLIYDDARRDDAGELASMIATAIGGDRLEGRRRGMPGTNDDASSRRISESLVMGVSVTKPRVPGE